MSDDLAISVLHLSKVYTIAHNSTKHTTLHEALISRIRHPFQKRNEERFWALRDISLEIKKGSVVGIIGRNGAGKSTLLKILSRITEPTEGKVDLYGRVGSLLEVGTGFHPELTGRENIYLNGQILGMRRKEIDANFDAIVDFAEVEKFLDTPVKRYSTGMYVRLAFAVAAYLDSDILIVDEVLAVGDAEFQKKCLGKMSDVAHGGRTVLLVSHNVHAIATLCKRAIVLKTGRIDFDGVASDAIARYLQRDSGPPRPDDALRRPGTGEYRFQSVAAGRESFDPGEEKVIRFRTARYGNPLGRMYLSALLVNDAGIRIAQFDARLAGYWLHDHDVFEGELRFGMPWPAPGSYRMDMYICAAGGVVDRYDSACNFEVTAMLPYGSSVPEDGYKLGLVLPQFEWLGTGRDK